MKGIPPTAVSAVFLLATATLGGGCGDDDNTSTPQSGADVSAEDVQAFFEDNAVHTAFTGAFGAVADALFNGSSSDQVTIEERGGGVFDFTVEFPAVPGLNGLAPLTGTAVFLADPHEAPNDAFPAEITVFNQETPMGSTSGSFTVTAQGGGERPSIFLWEGTSTSTDPEGNTVTTEQGLTVDITFPNIPLEGWADTEITSPGGSRIAYFEIIYRFGDQSQQVIDVEGDAGGDEFSFTIGE